MKKKFIYFLSLFLFLLNFYSENNKNIQLIIPFVEVLNEGKKENICFCTYYKGIEYFINIKDGIGAQLNIEETEIIQNFFIVIASSIEKVKSITSENLPKGLRISKGYDSLCYEISLKITKINDLTSYIWLINKVKAPENCLPENSIIICADPLSVDIAPFESGFCPSYPEINKNNNRVVFLPQVFVNSKKFKETEYKSCKLNLKEVHSKNK